MISRQSALIRFEDKDHKEMITWNGLGYQYHDKAYIWNGNRYDLVWEKLRTAQAVAIDKLVFRNSSYMGPHFAGGYFVGEDDITSNVIIKRKPTSYDRETLYIPPTIRYTPVTVTSSDGKLFWLEISGVMSSTGDGFVSQMAVLDIASGRLMSHVEYKILHYDDHNPPRPDKWTINPVGGMGPPAIDSWSDNYRAFDNGAGICVMWPVMQSSRVVVYTCWYTRNPNGENAGEVYAVSIPSSYTFIGQWSFFGFYAINTQAGKIGRFYISGTTGTAHTVELSEEINIPISENIISFGRYTNNEYFFLSQTKILLFNIATKKFTKIDRYNNASYISQGWGDSIILADDGTIFHNDRLFKKVGKNWDMITYNDNPYSRYYIAHMRGNNTFFQQIQKEESSPGIYQGYKFKEAT